MSDQNILRCLIIGSGPAGYTAAIYASRANLSPVLYQGLQPGGQLTMTTEVENFPGYPQGVQGTEMLEQFRQQAERFGADIRSGEITRVDLSVRPFVVEVNGSEELRTHTIIVATGARARYLGLADEEKYAGMGVSACATCDGFFYRNRRVAVVGGGDTACEEALYLSSLAEHVYLIVRKDHLRASQVMQERVFASSKIEVLFEHNTLGLFGEDGVEGAHLVYKKGTPQEEKRDIKIDGFFLAIGHQPNTDFLGGQIELDEAGYIKTLEGRPLTNIPGVFAAGDVADPRYRQAITSAGTGCQAALEVEKYLMEKGL